MDEKPGTGEAQRRKPLPFAPARIELLAFGAEVAHRFEIREVLGTGGYAYVYRAFDRTLGREVALKVLRQDRLSPTALRRLRREAAIARDAVHPRLVRIFDIEESAESVFLTMEVVDGGSLGERLLEGRLPLVRAVQWATQALEGLAALHALGILHRDIKPGNLLIDARGDLKVTDFGLALHLEREETRATTHESVLGTLEYLSPEQALGRPVDARSDLYSLGVVLFEMIAGRLPFETQTSLGSLLERLKKERLPSLRDIRPETPVWLAATVSKLLAREPGERYLSAEAALAELRERSARGLRTSGRRWWLALGGAAAAAALAAALFLARSPSKRFAELVNEGEREVRAFDGGGRELWSKGPVNPAGNFVLTHGPDRETRIAAFLQPALQPLSKQDSYLDILDPATGESLERFLLPSAHALFPGFSDTYSTWMRGEDLDGDGREELFVSFVHTPWYPSYVVLFEPLRQRSRVLFASRGHHYFAGAADLDGDGRKEVLLAGVNNRIGWLPGVAAIALSPPLDVGSDAAREAGEALAPDLPGMGAETERGLWYTLLPTSQRLDRRGRVTVDTLRRRLLFSPQGGAAIALDYDGFAVASRPADPPAIRRIRREQAYAGMREGERLSSLGFHDLARAAFVGASEAATAARDATLAAWVERRLARTLLLAGEAAPALARYERLWESSTDASEVAFEAARALHGLGDLDRAAVWYRRALGRGASVETGRAKFEVLQGLVFLLVERGRFDEARAECRAFAAAYGADSIADEVAFVDWRAGARARPGGADDRGGFQDLHRYWWLERRLAAGDDAEAVMRSLRVTRARLSEYLPLFDGLEAELAVAVGEPPLAALDQARSALAEARRLALTEPNYRVHLPILAERVRRIEAAALKISRKG